MTPTLAGRIQSRILIVLGVGIPWTILISPFLFGFALGSASFGAVLGTSLLAIFLTAFFGVVIWEPTYHLLQQIRWEKDWPTGLGLLTILNEGLFVLIVLALLRDIAPLSFLVHFGSTWLLIWFVLNGPIRVLLPRWRFRGGRFF